MAPDCTGPSDYLVLLAVAGTLKTHRLWRLRQIQRLIPSTAVMLSGTEWVAIGKLRFSAVSRSRAPQK